MITYGKKRPPIQNPTAQLATPSVATQPGHLHQGVLSGLGCTAERDRGLWLLWARLQTNRTLWKRLTQSLPVCCARTKSCFWFPSPRIRLHTYGIAAFFKTEHDTFTSLLTDKRNPPPFMKILMKTQVHCFSTVYVCVGGGGEGSILLSKLSEGKLHTAAPHRVTHRGAPGCSDPSRCGTGPSHLIQLCWEARLCPFCGLWLLGTVSKLRNRSF